MQTKVWAVALFCWALGTLDVHAQYSREQLESNKFFMGSSLFMLANLLPEESPDFVQLNLGFRVTPKDAISLELKTWRYFEPLGIPYGEDRANPEENFPGLIREHGFALVYQRFWWKGLYTGIHVMSAWQSFLDEGGERFDQGFQIFNTYRLGYHVQLWNRRFFIEPSIAITHRPIHTEMPESFRNQDDQWSKFFFGEPGFHFGVNF
ncbi:hypothetical protein [Pontibacter sp. G13]|uniref:hypothetical protein n=1 Tax=Pontibacter sp. G13 TaxID=3074898 RepID=UPI00288C467C|nr:hypothetical protein [Pontibacter sp. G13]WNJ18278.1 hypothetical protein RJD25_25785 [Pontibacter sp. G13]